MITFVMNFLLTYLYVLTHTVSWSERLGTICLFCPPDFTTQLQILVPFLAP